MQQTIDFVDIRLVDAATLQEFFSVAADRFATPRVVTCYQRYYILFPVANVDNCGTIYYQLADSRGRVRYYRDRNTAIDKVDSITGATTAMLFRDGEKWPFRCEIAIPDDRQGTPFGLGSYSVEIDIYVDRRGNLASAVRVGEMIDGGK